MSRKIWYQGEIKKYEDVKVTLLTHTLQYGSGIFEGIRAYKTDDGTAIFRLKDHIERFFSSAKILRINLGFTVDELIDATVKVVKENGFESCYIRPFAFHESDGIGVKPKTDDIRVAIIAVPFGKYLGDKSVNGIRAKISSWKRINSDVLSVQAKATGNYLNSVLASSEAMDGGYDEAILTSHSGYLAEGPGENIMLVKNGRLITPGIESDILLGITRYSIIDLSESLGIPVSERHVHKDELFTADEVFFCGTAAEITPVVNVDNIEIGNGRVGPITSKLMHEYADVTAGRNKKFNKWLTYVK